jgi:hypothetical protein
MNRSFEFHDSKIDAITQVGSDMVVSFAHAYVHESIGRPGIDPGIGLSYQAELTIKHATSEQATPKMPVTILEGTVACDNDVMEHLVPTGMVRSGRTTLALIVFDHESKVTQLTIVGDGIECRVSGDGEYVDAFPGIH